MSTSIPSEQAAETSAATPLWKPMRRTNLSERIADQLRTEIIEGRLRGKLPGHRELAGSFSVGMSSVREAISMLASAGLLEVRAGRGTFVVEGASEALALHALREPRSRRETEQVIEARQVLELELVALAASRARDEHVVRMREALGRMESALGDSHAYAEADLEMHLAIAQAADNPFLLAALQHFALLLKESMEISSEHAAHEVGDLRFSLESHRELVDRIEAGDGDRARAVLLEIMARHRQFVLGPATAQL